MSAPFAFPHWKPSAKRWTVSPAISWNIGKRRKKCHKRPDPPEIFQKAKKLRRYITAGNGQDNLLQLFLLYTFSVIHFFRSYTLRDACHRSSMVSFSFPIKPFRFPFSSLTDAPPLRSVFPVSSSNLRSVSFASLLRLVGTCTTRVTY